jgi:hypothetical protein
VTFPGKQLGGAGGARRPGQRAHRSLARGLWRDASLTGVRGDKVEHGRETLIERRRGMREMNTTTPEFYNTVWLELKRQ